MKRVALLLAMPIWAMAAMGQYTVSGVVGDEEQQTLPGANLVITELHRVWSLRETEFVIENFRGNYP